ncbi:MAG: hypothetical protein RBT75_03895 [Anaerolineae bacterium]|jgi:hypothetical protein|nr:hypothetical protein [Anaerolineae bacterium]
MTKLTSEQVLASSSLKLANGTAKIERLRCPEKGTVCLRIALWNEGQSFPLTLTEEELVTLVEIAIRQDVLSPDVIGGIQAITDI